VPFSCKASTFSEVELRYVLFAMALLGALFMAVGNATADSYPLMCHAGGGMSAKLVAGGEFSLTVFFKRASHGFSEQDPPKGTCAWNDRPTNPAEPTRLHVGDPTFAPLIMNRLKHGGVFTVSAFTQDNVLEVTSVDMGSDQDTTDGQMPSEAGQMPSEPMPSDMQMPSDMPVPSDEPAQTVASTDFSGQWDSQTEDGNEFTIELKQNGKIVNGTYDGVNSDAHGTIKGVIKGGALHFAWSQMKYKGSGVFTLADDGSSFEGSFTLQGQSSEKAWSGNRL